MKTMIRFWFVTASIFICTNLSLAQWVQTNVPYGGSKECIALCGSNLFVGTGSDGVFRSTDKGASWTQTSLTRGVVSALTVFPNGAGGSNILAGKCCNEGFYISIDSGAGWSAVNTVIPSYTVVYAFAVSPNGVGGSNLFAATDRGVFISTDNGTSWTAKNNGLPNASVMSLAVSGTNLFAGTGGYGGVYLTTNNGTNWTQTAPRDLGDVEALAVSGQNLFAGSFFEYGVFLSTNNGTSWTRMGLRWSEITALSLYGKNLFAGTWTEGVFVSTNNGANWTSVNTGLTMSVRAFAVIDTNLFAVGSGDVWKRPLLEMVMVPPHPFITSISDIPDDNGGKVLLTWMASDLDTNSTTLPSYSIWRLVSGGTNTREATQSGPGITPHSKGPTNRTMTYNGKDYNWEWIANLPTIQSKTYSFTAPTLSDSMSTTKGMQYFLVLANTNDPNVFYQSNIDSGYSVDNLAPIAPRNLAFSIGSGGVTLHWNPNAEPDFGRYAIYRSAHPNANPELLKPFAYSRDTLFTDNIPLQRGYYFIRAQDIHDNYSPPSNQVRAIGAGPFQSQWVETSLDSIEVLCFAENGTSLFAGTVRGVYRSTDGGTSWTAINTGLTDTLVNVLAAYGTNLFAATKSGVFRSSNSGGSWTHTSLTNKFVSAFAVSPNGTGATNLFASMPDSGVFLSTDNGTSWSAVNTGLTNTYILALAVFPNGTGGLNLFAGTYWAVFLSTNNGRRWTRADTGGCPLINSLIVSGTNLFAIADEFGFSKYSKDNAATLRHALVRPVSSRGNGLGGVYLSTNSGTSWTAVNADLPSYAPVLALAARGTDIFTGTGGDSGIYLSTNNGTNWTRVNTGLADDSVTALAVYGTNLFAGTEGGVWRRPLSEIITTSVRQSSAQAPERFELGQNYPNPFNPVTVISYSVPPSAGRDLVSNGVRDGQLAVNSNVTLKVFDLIGREVAVLVNERKDAGRYSVQWDASRFSSGIYFYRLKAGEFQETKRMSLIK